MVNHYLKFLMHLTIFQTIQNFKKYLQELVFKKMII